MRPHRDIRRHRASSQHRSEALSAEFTVVASNAPGARGRSSDPPPRSACPGTQSASPPSQRLQRIRRMASPESVPTLLLCGDNNRRAPLHAAASTSLGDPHVQAGRPAGSCPADLDGGLRKLSKNGEVLALLDASHGSSRHVDAQLLRQHQGLGIRRRARPRRRAPSFVGAGGSSSLSWNHAVRLKPNRSLAEATAHYQSSGYREVAPFNQEPFADHWLR